MTSTKTSSLIRYSLIGIAIASLMINNSISIFRAIGYIIIVSCMLFIIMQMVGNRIIKYETNIIYLVFPIIIIYGIGVGRNISTNSIKDYVLLVFTIVLFYVVSSYSKQVIENQNRFLKIWIPLLIVLFYIAYFFRYGINIIDGGYTGIFSTTTFSGIFMTLLVELCLLNYFIDKKRRWIIYSLLFSFLVYVTKVRTAYIAIVLIFLLFWFVKLFKNRINSRRVIKTIRILTYITIFSFIIIYPILDKFGFFDKLSSFVSLHTGKSLMTGRNITWQYYIQSILENPFFGYGLDYSKSFVDEINSVHNSYLNILLQVGFVGFICVFLFINRIFVETERSNNIKCHIIEGFSLINLIMCTTEVMLLQGQVILQLIMWIIMGVGIGLARQDNLLEEFEAL